MQARLALSGAADRAVTLGSNEQALAYLRSAIALTTEPTARAELLLRAGQAATRATRYEEAVALVREALDVSRQTGDPVMVGRAGALLGETWIDYGNPGAALAALEAAEAAFPAEGPPEVRAEILASLSRAYMRTNEPRRSVEAADRALELADPLGLDRLVAESLNNKGSSLGFLGRNREALALLEGAVKVARAGGHVAAEIRALTNLGSSSDTTTAALIANRASAELARRVGNGGLARWAEDMLRWFSFEAGEGWDEAIAGGLAQVEDDRLRGVGSEFDEGRTLAFIAYPTIARGEPVEDLFARLDKIGPRVSDPFVSHCLLSARGERAMLADDQETAIRLGREACADDEPARTIFASLAARAALWAHDREPAADLVEIIDLGPASSYPDVYLAAHRAGLAALDGRRDEAAAGYRDTVPKCIAIGDHFEAARLALDCVLLVGADHPVSQVLAQEARPIFERCRARPYLERLDAALAAVAVSRG